MVKLMHGRNLHVLLSSLLPALLWLSGCGPAPFKPDEEEGWFYKDEYIVVMPNDAIGRTVKPWITIRINEQYPYRNFYLREILYPPNADPDTLIYHFELGTADGKWKTESTGNILEFKFSPPGHRTLAREGDYIIHYQQFMREDYIRGIESLLVDWRDLRE